MTALPELAGPVVLSVMPSLVRPSTYEAERDFAVQPMVCGYIRARLCAPEVGVDSLQRALTVYARYEGLTLADIYVERNDALRRPDTRGSLIPSGDGSEGDGAMR